MTLLTGRMVHDEWSRPSLEMTPRQCITTLWHTVPHCNIIPINAVLCRATEHGANRILSTYMFSEHCSPTYIVQCMYILQCSPRRTMETPAVKWVWEAIEGSLAAAPGIRSGCHFTPILSNCHHHHCYQCHHHLWQNCHHHLWHHCHHHHQQQQNECVHG